MNSWLLILLCRNLIFFATSQRKGRFSKTEIICFVNFLLINNQQSYESFGREIDYFRRPIKIGWAEGLARGNQLTFKKSPGVSFEAGKSTDIVFKDRLDPGPSSFVYDYYNALLSCLSRGGRKGELLEAEWKTCARLFEDPHVSALGLITFGERAKLEESGNDSPQGNNFKLSEWSVQELPKWPLLSL
jgi:hypothetical protein